jgi:hypothetical protein
MTDIVDPKYARQAAERKAKRRARRRTRKGQPVERTCGYAQGRRQSEEFDDVPALAAVARAQAAFERLGYDWNRGYRVRSAYDDHGQRDAHVDE